MLYYYCKETNLETLISNIFYRFIKDSIRNLAYITGVSKLVSLQYSEYNLETQISDTFYRFI